MILAILVGYAILALWLFHELCEARDLHKRMDRKDDT